NLCFGEGCAAQCALCRAIVEQVVNRLAVGFHGNVTRYVVVVTNNLVDIVYSSATSRSSIVVCFVEEYNLGQVAICIGGDFCVSCALFQSIVKAGAIIQTRSCSNTITVCAALVTIVVLNGRSFG